MVPVKYGIEIMHATALVTIDGATGTVLVSHGCVELGQGIHTRVAQVAAMTLGVPLDLVRICDSSTDVVPNFQPTGGSLGTGPCSSPLPARRCAAHGTSSYTSCCAHQLHTRCPA